MDLGVKVKRQPQGIVTFIQGKEIKLIATRCGVICRVKHPPVHSYTSLLTHFSHRPPFNSYLLLFSLEIHLKTLRLLTIIRESLFIVRASSHSQEFVSHSLIKKRQGIRR